MIIAVTGGTGFIGRRLVAALVKAGHEVRVITRKPAKANKLINGVHYFQGDLTESLDLSNWLNGASVLFHCAGEISDSSSMEKLHIEGTRNLIKYASEKVDRWVQLSSMGAYGARRCGEVNEDDLPNPIGCYEETKVSSDDLVMLAGNDGAFDFSILRPSIVYGSEMPNQSLFAMLRMIEKGFFFFIGTPGASANYIHVDNVVKALIYCASKDEARNEVFNLSDYCTMEQFVSFMSSGLKVRTPNIRVPEWPVRALSSVFTFIPGWPLTQSRIDALTSFVSFPADKIMRNLNYQHDLTMEDGVLDLVNHYRLLNHG